MKTISLSGIWPRKDVAHPTNKKLTIAGLVLCLTLGFLLCGRLLQHIDFTAAILDIGILSVLFFGIPALVVAIFCSLWLQEILWKAFKTYRNNDRRPICAIPTGARHMPAVPPLYPAVMHRLENPYREMPSVWHAFQKQDNISLLLRMNMFPHRPMFSVFIM